MVHLHEVAYVLLRCALFVAPELIHVLLWSPWWFTYVHLQQSHACSREKRGQSRIAGTKQIDNMVQGIHMWLLKNTCQYPSQATSVLPSIRVCMAKQQCRQEPVPAFGHGTEKWRMRKHVNKKHFPIWQGARPLQIPIKLWFGRAPQSISQQFELPLSTRHCEGWKIQRTLLLKMLISSEPSCYHLRLSHLLHSYNVLVSYVINIS